METAKEREGKLAEGGGRENPAVVVVSLAISNVYLIRGDSGSVLVDTGNPDSGKKILSELRKVGVEAGDISLILLTHGHVDHFGSAAELKALTGAPVAIHRADAEYLRRGRNPFLRPTGLEGRLIKRVLKAEATGVEPDVLLEGEVSLEEWGVRGRVIETTGHTAGSVSVILPGGEAIVADIMAGGYMGFTVMKNRPRYHLFADDLVEVRRSIKKILNLSPKRIFPGHGGSLKLEAVRRRFAEDIEADRVEMRG